MAQDKTGRARVLDPIERASEAIFGVLMAMTFTGSLSAATAGREEIGTMLLTAVGCNIAWGLTDAVMYLVGTVTEKNRRATLLRRLRDAADLPAAHRLVADQLPDRIAEGLRDGTLVATLYAYGHVLGKYSGGKPWRYGLTIAAVGMVLVAIIIGLGG
jgi:hypothetical protein